MSNSDTTTDDTATEGQYEIAETPAEDPRDADTSDEEYREAADWGLDDLKASDEPVTRYITVGNRERRLVVREATDDDVPNLDRQSEDEVRRALAGFFREHIVEPAELSEITAEDIREMRVGVADKLLYAIIPERQGN